ncbi:double-strand break repair protein AddB [Celeribacter sp.]|uniref:double-strand break repair protein AddB n=1 Tax=Celeribacter sp. TaxID=1890673 RepID=UPI003A9158D6
MFEPSDKPRLFGLPCGVDFPRAVKEGLLERFGTDQPELLARTEIFVNTSRMKRDLLAAFDDGQTRLLPRVRLVTELGRDLRFRDLRMPVSGLRLRLELAQLITHFLDNRPGFAERSAVYGLADTLALLLGEMHDEDVTYETLCDLTLENTSDHWREALEFLKIVKDIYDRDTDMPPLVEERMRTVVERLATEWASCPPDHPVLVVGSTGSRGTTARFMEVVARLPQGAVIQPGVDFDMPQHVWDRLADPSISGPMHDHPQERIVRLATTLGLSRRDVTPFAQMEPPSADRNALLSLALRPAPVTDEWMKEGPKLRGIKDACANLTLIEAPDPRREATAVALVLRKAAEDNKRAALITPDRDLARQVSAMLDRWDIDPDDSAGEPLNQTPPGRLFRLISNLFGRKVTSEDMMVLLKHPLVAKGSFDGESSRGIHLLWTRQLEVYLRKNAIAFPDKDLLLAWADKMGRAANDKDARTAWVVWICDLLAQVDPVGTRSLAAHLDHTLALARGLASGPHGADDSALWDNLSGREMHRVMDELCREAQWGGDMTPYEFDEMFRAVIGRAMSRDPTPKHPNVMIWGTLEARSLQADLVIVGGLNDGIWPPQPKPDPWFSRDMRKEAGLLSPEQMVGLSAHDFQQAFGAKEVVISRALRNAETETVPCRWVIRLTNLLSGLHDEGTQAIDDMRRRGAVWIDWANLLDKPDPSRDVTELAKRPSPRPPVEVRPRELSVTRIETLIRDPYAIYASKILGLYKLAPLNHAPDPRDRGNAFHDIMERFVAGFDPSESNEDAASRLLSLTDDVLNETVVWPTERRIWRSRMRKVADKLAAREVERLKTGGNVGIEKSGEIFLADIDFKLSCFADRIDRMDGGGYHIFDYKASAPPKEKEAKAFRIQLLLEALILQEGTFKDIAQGHVRKVSYLGLDKDLQVTELDIDSEVIAQVRKKLTTLINNYDKSETGYTARRAPKFNTFPSDYDLLSRFKEWTEADDACAEDVQ